jgi:hypothetical protein
MSHSWPREVYLVKAGGTWDYPWVGTPGIAFDKTNYTKSQGEQTRTQPPLALFANHVVALVKLNNQTALFDPSYGALYENPVGTGGPNSTQDQLKAALADLIKQMDQPTVIPFYGQWLLNPVPDKVTGKPNWILVIRENKDPGTTLVAAPISKENTL